MTTFRTPQGGIRRRMPESSTPEARKTICGAGKRAVSQPQNALSGAQRQQGTKAHGRRWTWSPHDADVFCAPSCLAVFVLLKPSCEVETCGYS
jgi:hypothetical protein